MRCSKRVLLAFFFLALAMGCSAHGESSKAAPGWDRFQAFSEVLEDESQTYVPGSFHSRGVLDELADLEDDEQEYVLTNREFPRYFSDIRSHFEQPEQDKVCLVLNGVSLYGDYASLILSLVPEAGVLKFDQSLMHFVDSPDQWLSSAVCPQEFLEELHEL